DMGLEKGPFQISRDEDTIWCSRQATEFAENIGFTSNAIWEIAISVSELVTNVLKFAGTGTLSLRSLESPSQGIEVIVEDDGPGIEDIEHALMDGYSEGRSLKDTSVVERRGLGAGLGAVKRLMDEVEIVNKAKGGTKVTTRKFVRDN
ncbi:MAG: anti-sigma regulatory factor, partial [Proteobacteria bacterium]|nr:anti-sigma regulatory factor [Pseudomonadota bacterium]